MRKPRKDDLDYALEIAIKNLLPMLDGKYIGCPPDKPCERIDGCCGVIKPECWKEFAIKRAIVWGDEIKEDNKETK